MSITREPRRRMVVSKLLTNAKPAFVSLVDHGANQQPFHVVKAIGAVEQEKCDMTTDAKKITSSVQKGQAPVEIGKITFDKATFADEEAVKAFLTNAGLAADITEEDKHFVVKGDMPDDTELREIEGDTGVVFFVGKGSDAETDTKKSVDDPGVTTDEATKDAGATEEAVAKYAGWMAEYSNGKSISEVMAAGADGLPPGIFALNDAFYQAVRNNIVERDWAGVRTVAGEFADMIVRLSQLFESATVPEELVQYMIKEPEAVTKSVDTTDTPADTEATTVDTTKDTVDTDTATTDDATKGEPIVNADETAAVTKADMLGFAETLGAHIGASVSKALTDALGTVQKTIEDAGQTQEASTTELREGIEKTAGRIEALEQRSQVRKSADADETNTVTEPAKKERTVRSDPLKANLFGFSRKHQ